MFDPTRQRELNQWMTGVLLASVFAEPRDPGLTRDEILELASRKGFGQGEVHDLLQRVDTSCSKVLPDLAVATSYLIDFNDVFVDDPRNVDAYIFVCNQFVEASRQHSAAKAAIPVDLIVERGAAIGLGRAEVAVACASYLVSQQANLNAGIMVWKGTYARPDQQVRRRVERRHPASSALHEVKDMVARRSDGRSLSVDPIKAFAEQLGTLAHDDKRIWWQQIASELRTLDPQTHPTSFLVLAAALAEGALTVLVRRAQSLTGGAAFGARLFSDGSNVANWRFQDLLKGAQHESAGMIDQKLYDACMQLSDDRQRIHLGRFLEGQSTPPRIDIRPHEAQAADVTVKRLLVSLLEWLAARQGLPVNPTGEASP